MTAEIPEKKSSCIRDRAYARRQAKRTKKAHTFNWIMYYLVDESLRNNQRFIGRHATTPHPCSCRACGNQRKYEGETRQEKRAKLNFDDDMRLVNK